MHRLKMSESVRDAVRMVEHGHVRIGPETVRDSARVLAREEEDFVTWVDASKIKRKILDYQGQRDDYEDMC